MPIFKKRMLEKLEEIDRVDEESNATTTLSPVPHLNLILGYRESESEEIPVKIIETIES